MVHLDDHREQRPTARSVFNTFPKAIVIYLINRICVDSTKRKYVFDDFKRQGYLINLSNISSMVDPFNFILISILNLL